MKKKKIIVAPNSYKDSIDAFRISNFIEKEFNSILGQHHEVLSIPIGDGGDGTASVLARKLHAIKKYYPTTNAIGRRIKAPIYLSNNTAIIEMASVSGIQLIEKEDLNPYIANTEGLGKLIAKLPHEHINKLILCVGGSATVDMGLGMLYMLGVKYYDRFNKQLDVYNAADLHEIANIDFSSLEKFKDLQIDVLCDVENPLLGENGAVHIYGPQKGIKEKDFPVFDKNHQHVSSLLEKMFGQNFKDMKYAGAAGGITIALKAFFNCTLYNGLDYLIKFLDLDSEFKDCDILVTGEGCMDKQSSFGKAPYEIAKIANSYGSRCFAINGQTKELPNVFERAYSLTDYSVTVDNSMNTPETFIRMAARDLATHIQFEDL